MVIVTNLLLLLGGVAIFMYGMKMMSQGIEQSAGSGVRTLFKKISRYRVVDYGVGVGATSIIQSSSASSVLTVGLANAGIVSVRQGAGIVLGAKVGTTVTAFIISLNGISNGGFSVSALFSVVAFVGVIIVFSTSNDSLNKLAIFFIGFGMLFIGLEVMEYSIGGKDSMLSVELTKLFQYEVMKNPFMLVILGIVFTCIIQSSSAASGVFITLLATGVIQSVDQSFFLMMGANIGTCIDGLIASIGTNADGRRVAVFHVLTSAIGATTFSVILVLFRSPIVGLFESIFPGKPQFSLATYNLTYNVIYTSILLLFLDPLVSFVTRLVKGKQPKKQKDLLYIDDRLLATPAVAIEQALKEVSRMAVMAKENLDRAFDAIMGEDMAHSKKIADTEYRIDSTTRALASFFIKISSTHITGRDEKLIGSLHHVINDIERIGDYAVLLAKETNDMKQRDAHFPRQTATEMRQVYDLIGGLYDLCLDAFQQRSAKNLEKISDAHKQISNLLSVARETHTERLGKSMYSVEVSKSMYTMLFSLQRISDHMVNIGFSVRSSTGSMTEAFEKMGLVRKNES